MLWVITPERAVLESLRCPSCSTHYGLRPQRVRIEIRRAKCFRCGHLFDIQETVKRLLPPPPPESLLEEVPGLAASDLAGIEFQDDFFIEEPSPALAEGAQPDSLTLGDLEQSEGSMDTTLVDFTPPPPSEAHYTSAKDAISRLLGDVPPSAAATRPFSSSRSSNPMDVEATLEALENTLGGVQPTELDKGTATPGGDLGTTVRLNIQDLQAAMAQGPDEVNPAAQTLSMPLPQFTAAPQPAPSPALPPPQPTPITVPTAQDPNLLKLKIGEDLYENLTVDQISTWIEQGRVLDSHQVARQFSENWIEAAKVPNLRPVFERIKRLRSVLPEETQTATPNPEPVRKSLFGGLFGRN